jgi:hypothetical protein
VNPYAKIGIKVGVVVVICLIFLVAYNMVGHKAFVGASAGFQKEITAQTTIAKQLDGLLQYKDLLPGIRCVQLRDMETIRVLIPPANEFVLTGYLRTIHAMLTNDHLETQGIVIGGAKPAVGGTTFEETFVSDVTALQGELDKITTALQMFKDNQDKMQNLLTSFQFYEGMATGSENFAAIQGGIEVHSFSMSVRGSYDDIKKFTFDVFNMRPHTALVNFQMVPQGAGIGPARVYQASFSLITYGDANAPPPLWIAYHGRGEQVQPQANEGSEGGTQKAQAGGAPAEAQVPSVPPTPPAPPAEKPGAGQGAEPAHPASPGGTEARVGGQPQGRSGH